MSYISMDHAGWVEANIAAHKRMRPRAADRRLAAESRGWYAAPDTLNPFQRRAFSILGIVGNGIYNAPIAWGTVRWQPDCVAVSWRRSMGTYDFDELTRLVLLCHEARIRGWVAPLGLGYLEISLSERWCRPGRVSRHHPDLHEVVLSWRAEFPVEHPIRYREPEVTQ